MKSLLDDKHFVPIAHALDLNGGATVDCDSINMKNFKRALLIFTFDTLGTASAVLTINSGATDGTISSALTFNYAWASAAIGSTSCDVLAASASAATLTITHGTYSDYMLVIDLPASQMDMANGEEWLTARFTDPGGATGTVDGIAFLEPRYSRESSGSALA
jgi:hypothetical protein